jgi:hypothetical protein
MKLWLKPQQLARLQTENLSALTVAIRELRAERASVAEIASLERRLSPQLAANVQTEVARSGCPAGAGWSGARPWTATLVLVAGAAMIGTLKFSGDTGMAPQSASEPANDVHLSAAPGTTPASPVEPQIDLQPLAAAGAAPATTAATEPHAPSARASRLRTGTQKPAPVTAAQPAGRIAPAASGPEAELDLVQRAQAALEHRPAATLALTEQHAQTYPRGIFAQEREVLAIEALLKLARRPAALARAEEFLARYPTSPHARRVRPLLERAEAATTLSPTHHP